MARTYKDRRIYGCFILNRLVSEMDIDLYQADLERKLPGIFEDGVQGISKEELKHEIRSNHYMTNKVIAELEQEGLVQVNRDDTGRYLISITFEGVLHIRRYNDFFLSIYREQIRDHYRYRKPPQWVREKE